jgi:PPM family protein phosphatase
METTPALIIKETAQFPLDNFEIEILSYLGILTANIYYFKVKIINTENETPKFGLLRVGAIDSNLSQELELRTILQDYKLVAELLANVTLDHVIIDTNKSLNNQDIIEDNIKENSQDIEPKTNDLELEETEAIITDQETNDPELETTETIIIDQETQEDNDYLEEEYYPEEETITPKILLLTDFPDQNNTLATWLQQNNSSEDCLAKTTQICQFFNYIYQKKWLCLNLVPELIELGKPLKFFDLTNIYPLDKNLESGIIGNYTAPELLSTKELNQTMSTYTIGAFLYQSFHQQIPQQDQLIELEINPIPRIYQLLKISLSPVSEERFTLEQFLSLLVETKKIFNQPEITWKIASHSTIGLSTHRLQNEDNYGIRQQQLSNTEKLIVAVVADGMGGMAQGELASKIAVETVLKEPISEDFNTEIERNQWLINLVEKANQAVTQNVNNGGTTLSLILAVNDQLMLAHVGDSRIYLLRDDEIQQLSEDHSYVAILLASGQITLEESINHPDRNLITKSLGSKNTLSPGYVQDLTRTIGNLFLTLKNNDILLLCSDGVWDLIPNTELQEIFTNCQYLSEGVDQTITKILERGASDNATLLALQYQITKS